MPPLRFVALPSHIWKNPLHHVRVSNRDSHEKKNKTPKTRLTVHALKVVSHGFNLHLGGGKRSWVFFKTFIE